MKRTIAIMMLLASITFITCSCGKQNTEQNQGEQKRDALVGTVWKTEVVTPTRFLHFLEGGKAKISLSDRTKTYDGIYSLEGNNITFVIGFEILGYSNGLVHSFNYSYKTGTIDGNIINTKGVIYSDTAVNGQEFIDIYTKVE